MVDTTAPTVSIAAAASQADPTRVLPINFTVTFSESVTGFTTAGLTLGGTSTGSKTAVITGSGTTYNVAVSGATGTGTVTAAVNAGAASDAAGNNNTASGTASVTYDITPPTVSSISRVSATPTNAASLQWTVTFSESVTGVNAADFALAQAGGVSGATISTVTGSGTTYTVTTTTGSGDGTLGLEPGRRRFHHRRRRQQARRHRHR